MSGNEPVGFRVCDYGASLVEANLGRGEILFLGADSKSKFSQSQGTKPNPVRGGVPLIFPQFLDLGALARHGFARSAMWHGGEIETTQGETTQLFVLTNDDVACQWPKFSALYEVSVAKSRLKLTLEVENLSDEPWSFTCALHTYFSVSDIADVVVRGLSGLHFDDMLTSETSVESRQDINISEPVDRRYYGVGEVCLSDSNRTLSLISEGFQDLVLWNPWLEGATEISDLHAEEYRQFVCLEAALLTPTQLLPGQKWVGQHCVVQD